MNNQPLISIGIFVYNEEKYIAKTIESWLNQDYQNIQIVISDNASEDQTFEISQQYAEKDHRIILHRNSQNLGAAFNAKKVFEMSTGKYFIWSSGHDYRDVKLLSTCVDILESNTNIVLAYPQAHWINEKGESLGLIEGCIETRGLDFLSRLNVVLWGLGYASPVYGLLRTDTLKKVSLGKSLIAPDVLVLCELSILGEFAYIPIPLLKIRKMPDYGSWNSYVSKVFNTSLFNLSIPEIFWDMLKQFVTNVTKHINDPNTKQIAISLIIQGLMTKYGGILVALLTEKNSDLSEQEQITLRKIQNISTFLQENNDLLSTNLIDFSDDLKSKQAINITELKSPIILIDGVFFQLYKTGIARVWKSLLEQWANTDFAQHIIVLDRNGTAPKITGIYYINTPPYDYNNAEGDRAILQQICDEQNAKLFISTYYTTPITTPSIFMGYDMIPEAMQWDLTTQMWQAKHQGINHASAYITISQHTKDDLIKFFPSISQDLVTVAYCGVSEQFKPSTPQEIQAFQYKYGMRNPYFLIVSIGGYKNTELFLQAFNQLPYKQSFDIVCTGGQGSLLPDEWRQYTAGSTLHNLYLNDDELRLAYSGAIALVYPSKYEGFGMPVLEAMACGCPVITCANASIPEVGGDAVLYVKDDDINGLAEALCDVQKPRIRQHLINAGIAQSKKFSWAEMADIVSDFLLKNTLQYLNLREINVIIFPDWTQSEDDLYTQLAEVISAIATSDHVNQTTLLIDISNSNPENADTILSGIAMNLMMEYDIDISENMQISVIEKMSEIQWETLLPMLNGRIVLEKENEQAIANQLSVISYQ